MYGWDGPEPLVFIPGVDFDPTDREEVEHVRLATEQNAADRLRYLERQNASLKGQLQEALDEIARLRGEMD